MFLPEPVLQCIQTLEQAGFEAYAVGGCVRDALLGLQPHDYDLCTGATPQMTARLFSQYPLVRSGEKHGTIGVVMGKDVIEITTFRTEGGYQDSRHPDWVRFVTAIEEDLARRDFTVNAMAYSPIRGYIDPFGGQQDLQNRILRTVGCPGDRFREDALRILRGVRFSVRYQLSPEAATLQAMKALASTMETLANERVFEELCKLLPFVTAKDLLAYIPVLIAVLPELAPSVSFEQRTPYHRYDVFTHTAHVVEATPPVLALRWAALLHDCGKPASFQPDENGRAHFPSHANISGEMADAALLRLKAPTALREQVVFLVAHHMLPLEPDKRLLRRRLGKYGQQALLDLLALQQADVLGMGTDGDLSLFRQLHTLIEEVLSEEACLTVKDLHINGQDLLSLGFSAGPQLGKCLQWLLERVQDERLPNAREALLRAAADYLKT